MTHATRHETRLNRDLGRKRFADTGYAMEELVAEIGAAFLCADLGIYAGDARRPRRLYRVMAEMYERRQAGDLYRREPRTKGRRLSSRAATAKGHRSSRRDAGFRLSRGDSIILKAADGAASITTPQCASPAYGFLVSERETIPPSGPRPARLFEELAVPNRYRPRGAAVAHRAPHPKFDRNHAPPPDRRTRAARQCRRTGSRTADADPPIRGIARSRL